MVHQQGVGTPCHCLVYQTLAGSHPRDEPGHDRPTLNLQAIGAVILKPVGLQAMTQILMKLPKIYAHSFSRYNTDNALRGLRGSLYYTMAARRSPGPS